VKCSLELVQDSGFDVETFLASAFSIRFGRGIGAGLVTTLTAGSTQGVSAGASSITVDNIYDLFASLDQSYLASAKCAWLMRLATLVAIQKLTTSAGAPAFDTPRDADGTYRLLGLPVRLAPSVAAIGTTNKSVFLGDLSYLFTRVVRDSLLVKRLSERYAEAGEVAFIGFLRCSSAFAKPAASDSPVKYLVHA
jgi:HK97 family phage major capsid protein